MSTRIVANGHVAWQNRPVDLRRQSADTPWNLRRGHDGDLEVVNVDSTGPAVAQSRIQAGLTYRDPDEDLVYRVIQNAPGSEGWANLDYWCRRYSCGHGTIVKIARTGAIDCAVLLGTPARYYRVRDERRVTELLKELRPMQSRQVFRPRREWARALKKMGRSTRKDV